MTASGAAASWFPAQTVICRGGKFTDTGFQKSHQTDQPQTVLAWSQASGWGSKVSAWRPVLWVETRQNGDVGPPSCRPPTCRKAQGRKVHSGLGFKGTTPGYALATWLMLAVWLPPKANPPVPVLCCVNQSCYRRRNVGLNPLRSCWQEAITHMTKPSAGF